MDKKTTSFEALSLNLMQARSEFSGKRVLSQCRCYLIVISSTVTSVASPSLKVVPIQFGAVAFHCARAPGMA